MMRGHYMHRRPDGECSLDGRQVPRGALLRWHVENNATKVVRFEISSGVPVLKCEDWKPTRMISIVLGDGGDMFSWGDP